MDPNSSNPLVTFIQDDIILLIDYVLVPLVFSLAFIVFLWGIFNFFIAGGADEEKREKGKQFMVWGFIAFFVMVSLWGIVNLMVGTFGFGGQQRPDIPSFNQRQNTNSNPTFPTGTSGRACQDAFDCDGLACLNGFCASGQGVN